MGCFFYMLLRYCYILGFGKSGRMLAQRNPWIVCYRLTISTVYFIKKALTWSAAVLFCLNHGNTLVKSYPTTATTTFCGHNYCLQAIYELNTSECVMGMGKMWQMSSGTFLLSWSPEGSCNNARCHDHTETRCCRFGCFKNALEKLFRANSMVYLWSGAGCTIAQSFANKGATTCLFIHLHFLNFHEHLKQYEKHEMLRGVHARLP